MATTLGSICYFCDYASYRSNILSEDEEYLVLSDNYPIATGHALIVPKYHESNIFNLNPDLYLKLFMKTREYSKIILDKDKTIEGFNIGVNQGAVAGQTVMHAHIHLVPRRYADTPDPRGGIRWIFPDKAKYKQ